MPEYIEENSCLIRMLSSIKLIGSKFSSKKSKSNTPLGQIKKSHLNNSIKNKQDQTENKKKILRKQQEKDNHRTKLSQHPNINQIIQTNNIQKGQKQTNFGISQNQNAPNTDRFLIEQFQPSFSDHDFSNENDVMTEKSEIIINDINKSLDHNQNLLYHSEQKQGEIFDDVYQKIKVIKTWSIYQEYLVKKKTKSQILRAYVLRSFCDFEKQWNMTAQESIERYCEIYEREKKQIRNIVALNKSNCKYRLKMIDYEIKPPFYDLAEEKIFNPGKISIVFQNYEQNLQQYLNRQRALSKLDKKNLIYQICTCLADIHQEDIQIQDLSLSTFMIDQFSNIKFFPLSIEPSYIRERRFFDSVKKQYLYLSPSELGLQINTFYQSLNPKTQLQNKIKLHNHLYETDEQKNLWKLGIIIAKILTGKFIFQCQSMESQKQLILDTFKKINSPQKTSISLCTKLAGLSLHQMIIVQSLLQLQPQKRKSCKELLQFQYLRNILEDSQDFSLDNATE